MSLKVFTVEEELLPALKAAPSTTMMIEKKKNEKEYKGTVFLDTRFNIGSFKKKEGWFSFRDVELSSDIADPEDTEDKRNAFEKTRLNVTTTVSRSGDLGEAMMILQTEWKKWVEKAIADKVIDAEGKKVHDLVQMTYSKKNKEKGGQRIEDPYISFKIDFDPFPQKYPHKFLVGQPKTQFFDARTKFTDAKGNEQYKPAMVVNDEGNEELVNVKNIHKFITRGSKIVKGKFMMQSVAISAGWISMPMTLVHAVVMPGLNDGFSDDVAPVNSTNTIRDAVKATLTPTTSDAPPVPAPEKNNPPETQLPTKDEINDALDALN